IASPTPRSSFFFRRRKVLEERASLAAPAGAGVSTGAVAGAAVTVRARSEESGADYPRNGRAAAPCACRRLQVHAAPAVHGDDLAGDVGRVEHQEAHRARDVRGRSYALEQGVGDDALAFFGRKLPVLR